MFLLGNKFYIIFISLWIFGLYAIFTTFHSTPTNNDKALEDRIEYLQSEVESLQQKLSQLQSGNNINVKAQVENNDVQCQELREELKRVKRKLASKTNCRTGSQNGPALEYEQLRRKIETQTRELSYFTIDQLYKINEKLSDDDKAKWSKVIARFSDQN
ncbi:unnamed protein product, partial [Adineta steineri]